MIKLKLVKEWALADAFVLIDYLKSHETPITTVWRHKTCEVVLANPDKQLIRVLKQNKQFWNACWHSTQKGNVYTFLISPVSLGFKRVPDYAKGKGIPRQYVYNSRYKYDLVYESPQKVWVREKQNLI
jgi:hypothetical protein